MRQFYKTATLAISIFLSSQNFARAQKGWSWEELANFIYNQKLDLLISEDYNFERYQELQQKEKLTVACKQQWAEERLPFACYQLFEMRNPFPGALEQRFLSSLNQKCLQLVEKSYSSQELEAFLKLGRLSSRCRNSLIEVKRIQDYKAHLF